MSAPAEVRSRSSSSSSSSTPRPARDEIPSSRPLSRPPSPPADRRRRSPQAPKTEAPPAERVITTELIQKYLDENQSLILAILENQNVGKLSDCATYQTRLQQNLMYLAAIAGRAAVAERGGGGGGGRAKVMRACEANARRS